MRIAIDARLNAYRQGGISQYTRQLLMALPDVARDDEFVCLQHRDQLRPLAIAPNVSRRTALTPPHHRFEQWTLPLEVMLARPNVLHCPDFIAPTRRPCPAVVTIHDLAFMHYPEILDDSARAYYGQVKSNAPRADGVIAVSEATRQDIAQFLDMPAEQIDVIHEAAASLYQPIELRAGEARVLNGKPVQAGSFLLFVSTLEPRKNLPTLLQALRICLDRQPNAGYRLLIVGRRGWRDEAIFAAVRDLNLADHVQFAGGVGQYDLRWLYNACRIYINPSLYEGFGLPLLEAMACGAACLAAATSSLPEIGGNAAVYVPPLDADIWADEIAALWDDDERRAELGRMGVARARQFSWARAARETMAVYRRAAERLPTRAVVAPPAAPLFARELAALEPSTAMHAMHVPSPGGPRACLRCGANLVPGTLQSQLALRPLAEHESSQPIAPRMWACARCGHVELVLDWSVAVHQAVPDAPEAAQPLAHAEANADLPEPIDAADAPEEIAPPVDVAAEASAPEEIAPPADAAAEANAPEEIAPPAAAEASAPEEIAPPADAAADEPEERLAALEIPELHPAPLDAIAAAVNGHDAPHSVAANGAAGPDAHAPAGEDAPPPGAPPAGTGRRGRPRAEPAAETPKRRQNRAKRK